MKVRNAIQGAVVIIMIAAAPFVFLAGCGSEGVTLTDDSELPLLDPAVLIPDATVPDEVSPPIVTPEDVAELGEIDKTEELILGEAYDGALILHLDESMRAFVVEGQSFIAREESKSNDLAAIEAAITSYPQARYRPFLDSDPEQLDARRAELERLSGQKMPDWNSVVVVEIAEPAEAVRLLRELRALRGIEVVYPKQKPILLDLTSTPDLTGLQGYLYPESTHGGLNAQAAWSAGIRGAGTVLVDGEGGWNFSHEDLPLRPSHALGTPFCTESDGTSRCFELVNHGTAVIGEMAGMDNGHGITGMAPDVGMYAADALGLSRLTDGIGSELSTELPGGTIFVVEVGGCGALGDTVSGCRTPPYGQVPLEASFSYFNAVRQATAAGITVVDAAGNGSIDLGNPAAYLPSQVNISLPGNDTGSIMVGGSYGAGHDHRRPPELNCGTRVNAFAWGSGVVTAGYPYTGNPFTWTTVPGGPNPPNDHPNRHFINNFGGTSAATAMVAGAAALVQSYAKREMAHTTRYLMPLKMREILVNSGVPQTGGGCNIGMQPRVDEAMRLVDSFLTTARRDYPEWDRGDVMNEERMIALRTLGVGLQCVRATPERSDISCPWEYICVPRDPARSDPRCSWEYRCIPHDPVGSDPGCPDEYLWPTGTTLAKDLDFDGDGRADLVQWTPSTWKLDLSSRGSGGDNYGAWDIEISYPPIAGRWVWPYVIDMNRDGRTDFVVYDKEHGTWHVAFTNSALIRDGAWHGWDWTIDYSSTWTDTLTLDPFGTNPAVADSRYSRPAPGDYNNDGWIDIAIACSDGNWRIDHGGAARSNFGTFDRTVRVLSDAQLAAAPGWAYLTFMAPIAGEGDALAYFGYKVPDGIAGAGRMAILTPTRLTNLLASSSPIFGGNEFVPMAAEFYNDGGPGVPGIKGDDNWQVTSHYTAFSFHDLPPINGFGGYECQPINANFDGDDYADRAVMCPNEWRIAYSSSDRFLPSRDADGFRRVPLNYDETVFTLPGRSYAGGVSYGYVRSAIEFSLTMDPATPPQIPVDMMTSSFFGPLR